MKYKLSAVLTDLRGQEFSDKATFQTVLETALLTDRGDSLPQEKVTRYKLALKIALAPEEGADLTSDDIVLMKKLVVALYPPLLVGKIYELFGEL